MILVIGDLILDEALIFDSNKICPEAPVPILKLKNKKYFIGGAGNVANNLKKLKSKVFLISKTGNNKNSKKLVKMIKNCKIKNKIFTQKSPCTVKKRIFKKKKMFCRIDNDNLISFNKFEINKITKFLNRSISKFSILIISDYDKGLISKNLYSEIIKIFKSNNKIIIINPKKSQIKFYQGCNIIIPNQIEFNNFFKNNISLASKIDSAFDKLKSLQHLIVTRGHKSLIYKNKNNKLKYFKINKIKPIDVTGASDTFIATLAHMLLRKKSIEYSINKSILASRKVIKKKFTSYIKLKEIN